MSETLKSAFNYLKTNILPTKDSVSNKEYFSKHLNYLRSEGLYPAVYTIEGASSSPEIFIDGKHMLTFSSNNYLGLADHPEIVGRVVDALKQYGVGSGSTRLLSGTLDVQVEFEAILAEFMGFSDSISFSSGYLANAGVIRMLVDKFPYYPIFNESNGVIFSDALNHASMIDGVRLAKSEREVYKHNDMESLERALSKHKNKRKLIITDGVFSMDGVLANLEEIIKLAKAYDALVYVDDSHAVGVLGPNGEGTCHELGVEKDVDVIMGSFTKAFGSIGGFIVSDEETADYLRITARSYIFSDPIIPSVVAGLIKAIEIIKSDAPRRMRTLTNAEHLREGLRRMGFTVIGEKTPIVPLMIGNESDAIKFYKLLSENGILAPCIRQPAVPVGKERIRFSVMASHTPEQIDTLLSVCDKIGKELKLIK